ncbi:MAG TPA: hypothetical protein PLX06_05865 [Fimbriimonadaceae bacterium]|nr:hypothetical protein [Fimbriimonadaceae bacterium]
MFRTLSFYIAIAVAPYVLALVPMTIWRVDSFSGLMIGGTTLIGIFQVCFILQGKASPRTAIVAMALFSVITLVVLFEAASRAVIPTGGALRQVDQPAQLIFLMNTIFFGVALLRMFRPGPKNEKQLQR